MALVRTARPPSLRRSPQLCFAFAAACEVFRDIVRLAYSVSPCRRKACPWRRALKGIMPTQTISSASAFSGFHDRLRNSAEQRENMTMSSWLKMAKERRSQ